MMKNKYTNEQQFHLVKRWFEERGANVLKPKSGFANGVDLVAVTDKDALRVEIKKLYYASRAWKTKPVGKNRMNDDFIAVVFPCGYVFVERMEDHLKCCTKSGYRFFTVILPPHIRE